MAENSYKLQDPATLTAFQGQLEQARLFDQVPEAHRFVRRFEEFFQEHPEFETTYPEAAQAYREMLLQARCIALPLLSVKEAFDLLENHFVTFLKTFDFEAMLKQKLNAVLLTMFDWRAREEFKRQLHKALWRNSEVLTPGVLSKEGKEVKGTVGNWLFDYNRYRGGATADPLKQIEYLATSPAAVLSALDKQKLLWLLHFYDYLKLSTLTPEGSVEHLAWYEDGKWWTIEEQWKIKPIEASPDLQKVRDFFQARRQTAMAGKERGRILKAYRADLQDEHLIKQEMTGIEKITAGQAPRICDYLYQLLQAGKPVAIKNQVLAALRLLAQNGYLPFLLKQDQRFANLLRQSLQEQKRFDEFKDFSLQPTHPKYIARLLRLLLEQRLKMSGSEAARAALQIFNAISDQAQREKFVKLVFFDMQEGEFKWA